MEPQPIKAHNKATVAVNAASDPDTAMAALNEPFNGGAMTAQYDVFISYAHTDIVTVQALADALKWRGLTVWRDQDRIDDFASITDSITRGLAHSKVLLAYYSAMYPTRRACQWELTAAFLGAQRLGDPRHRVLIVNPMPNTGHIQPIELRDTLFLLAPSADDSDEVAACADRIEAHVRKVNGELGHVVHGIAPRWIPKQHTGSTRFVGRVPDLWRLHTALTVAKVGVITGAIGADTAQVRGLGGIGKTLLAEEYALRFGAAYPGGIFWLRAFGHDDRTGGLDAEAVLATFDDEVRAAAKELGLRVSGQQPAEVRAAVHRWIDNQGQQCLWVVDDVPGGLKVEELQRLLSPHPLAATLLTTRSRAYTASAKCVELDVLSPDDSYELLTRHHQPADCTEADAARALAIDLGGHALALDVAGAALSRRVGLSSFKDFRATLAQEANDELEALAADLREELPTGHEHSIACTLSRSISELDQDGWDFLRLAAVMAAAPIPARFVADVFHTALLAREQDTGDVDNSTRRAANAIEQAHILSLAALVDSQEGTWQVHPLVARTARFTDPASERRAELRDTAVRVINGMIDVDVNDPRARPELADVVAHAQALISRLDTPVTTAEESLLGTLARHDYIHGRYQSARNLWEQELAARRRLLGEQAQPTLITRNNLASACRSLGDFTAARELLEEALAAWPQRSDDEDYWTLLVKGNLAETLHAMGDYVAARELHERSLAAHSCKLGESHPGTLVAMNNLAATYRRQGDLTAARALLERALAAAGSQLGDEHAQTLTLTSNLAEVLSSLGEHDAARKLLKQALPRVRGRLGAEHPDTLLVLHNLAGALHHLKQYNEARELAEQALTAYRQVLGDEHPDTLAVMHDLGYILLAAGKDDAARDLAEQTLARRHQVLGAEHPDTKSTKDLLEATKQGTAVRMMADLLRQAGLAD